MLQGEQDLTEVNIEKRTFKAFLVESCSLTICCSSSTFSYISSSTPSRSSSSFADACSWSADSDESTAGFLLLTTAGAATEGLGALLGGVGIIAAGAGAAEATGPAAVAAVAAVAEAGPATLMLSMRPSNSFTAVCVYSAFLLYSCSQLNTVCGQQTPHCHSVPVNISQLATGNKDMLAWQSRDGEHKEP